MKKQVLLLFIGITSVFTYSQNGIISGKITDAEGNLSLPGATISLNDGERYTISNHMGNYEFLNIPAATYLLEVHYMGYQTFQQEITVLSGQNLRLNIVLTTEAESLDQVLVIGDRLRGQAKALNQQKNNQNITNIISSDQVGRFPDANVGDALKRVSGITIQNDQGEARNIIIRGLAPNLNSVTINGDRIPSAEGDNRNVQMDLIPSDMISSIEVNKTLTPDMDADAIGGSVNLILRSAPNGERISATLAGGYSQIREKGNYTAGLVYGNRFANDKVGLILSGSYNNNNFGSDNVEAVWAEDDFGNVFVEEKDIRKYDIQRIRTSVALALDYNYNSNNTLYLNAMYNERYDRENRYRASYRGIEPIYDDNDNIIGYEGDIRRQTKGGIDDKKNKGTRLEDQNVQSYSIGGEHLLSPKLDFDWSVNYSTASEDRPNERYIEFHNRDLLMGMNLSDPRKPLITSAGDNQLEDYSLREITQNHDYTEEEEVAVSFNFRVPFSILSDQKGRLRFGGKIRVKEKLRNNIFYEYEPLSDIENITSVSLVYWNGDNWQAGSQYIPGYFVSKDYLGGLDLGNPTLFESEAVPAEYLSTNYMAQEGIYAAYLRWDQDFSSKFSMIAGVRMELTYIDYQGNYVMDEEDLIGEINNHNNYINLLPSISFKYDIQDNLILRTAFSTALARPNYYELAPYVNVISEDEEIFAGNPELDATYSYNVDLMIEKYFKSVGILSGGVFYKKLNDFIYKSGIEGYTREMFSENFPNQSNPIPAGENWYLTQSQNGESVDLYGFEVAVQRQLDFLPGSFLKNFGFYINYTYTKSEADGITNEDGDKREGLGLPGTAPHMFNGSLSWENKRFSARVSLNYASDYLDELGGNEFEDRYYDEQLFLDANASYKITDYLRIFAEANNLTNQPLRYYQGISERTMQMEYYTPRFNLGVKFDF